MKKKFSIFTVILLFLCIFFVGTKFNVSATNSNLIQVEGAQVRTSGTAGIRFVASVSESYDKSNVSAYGIALAFGDANAESVVLGAKVNGQVVVSGEVSNLNVDNQYAVILVDIPASMYGKKVTARAYVVDNDNIVYSETVISRSIGQVVLAAKNQGDESELIDEIYEELLTNYKNTYIDSKNNVYLNSSVYETNPSRLREEFIADWNEKFGTTWTKFEYIAFQSSAKSGSNPLTTNNDNNCSGTNLYEFFVNDEYTSAKWQWMLNYFIAVDSGKVHPVRQAKAILNGGSFKDNIGNELWQFLHLSASIANFFNEGSCRDINNDIVFNNASKYAKVEEYNHVIYSINPNLCLVGKDIQLADLSAENGYEFVGYKSNEIECKNSFTVVHESLALEPQFKATEYTIEFYDGNKKILEQTYTIESEEFNLLDYAKDGYAFRGWYDNPDFEGEQITSISKGSTGDLMLFAKLEETSNVYVDVILDSNGGTWDKETLLANATIDKKATIETYLTYDSNGFKAGLMTSKQPVYWYYIALVGSSIEGVYEIKQIVYKNSAVTVDYDFVIAWHSSMTNVDSKTALNAIYNNANDYLGDYVIFENIPSSKTSTASITMSVLDASEITKKITKQFIDEETLPVPTNADFRFLGWKSSLDGSVVSKFPGFTTNPGTITYTAVYQSESASINANVTFDYNGGVTEELYKSYGTKQTDLKVNSYNGSFWTGTNYQSNIFISNSANDPKATFSTRVYLALNEYTGLYEVVTILTSGTKSSWPTEAKYVITISGEYSGEYDDNFNVTKISVGTVVLVDREVTSINISNVANLAFYNPTITNDEILVNVTDGYVLPTPSRVGYTFAGWEDDYKNVYAKAEDFEGIGTIVVYAKWQFEDRIIGSFTTESWVAVGDTIELDAYYVSGYKGTLKWTSSTPSIATVDQNGAVKGVSEGLATIVVSDFEFENIKFTFYVTVLASDPTGIVSTLVNSNNEEIFTKENLLVGVTYGSDGAYYTDITGSVSKLLFENYVVHDDYYLSSPSNKSTYSSGGVQFITVHYAADMPYSASAMLNGGKNLASYNKTCNTNGIQASYHYSVGNDGIWHCQNDAYGSWHAGASKTMTWTDSGLTTAQVGTDLYTTDVTMGSNGYFYIKGVKTNVYNTTSGTKLNGMGLGIKVEGNKVYLGGHYYNTSYKYISSTGGNNNSIGMETSVRQGSDLWLTWQYTAQLCAKLLLNYNLPLNRLVGHHFFSGKWCPQPMLENDLEIWYEFVEMVRQQMELYKNYSSYTLSMTSNSSYVNNKGRVTSLPTYSECVTYTVTYKTGSTTKTVTLSTIIPGTVA